MSKDFYEICKSVVGKLELTKEQGIARDVILNMLDMKEEESKDYLTRINKAIEYIKSKTPQSLVLPNGVYDTRNIDRNDLLDILGDNNEE